MWTAPHRGYKPLDQQVGLSSGRSCLEYKIPKDLRLKLACPVGLGGGQVAPQDEDLSLAAAEQCMGTGECYYFRIPFPDTSQQWKKPQGLHLMGAFYLQAVVARCRAPPNRGTCGSNTR